MGASARLDFVLLCRRPAKIGLSLLQSRFVLEFALARIHRRNRIHLNRLIIDSDEGRILRRQQVVLRRIADGFAGPDGLSFVPVAHDRQRPPEILTPMAAHS